MAQFEQKDFFISYTQADLHWAEWIAWVLEEEGYTTILQAWDFQAGSNFVLEMHRAAEHASRTLAVLSPDYLNSCFVQSEWAAAFLRDPTGEQGYLVPVCVRECKIPGLLEPITYINLINQNEVTAREVLLNGVNRGRKKVLRSSKFPGKTAYSIQGQHLFSGAKGKVKEQNLINLPANQRMRYFWTGTILTFLLGLLYPISTLLELPYEHAERLLKHNPNFCVFYLTIFPFTVGLLSSTVNLEHFKSMSRVWITFFVFSALILTPALVIIDALNKGPPISPSQLHFDSSNHLQEVLEKDLSLRIQKIEPDKARDTYIQFTAGTLSVPEDSIRRFWSLKDFFRRGSFTVFSELIQSMFAGIFSNAMFCYVCYLPLHKIKLYQARRDSLVLGSLFLSIWFPLRLYSIWYQNYYSLDRIADLFQILIVFITAGFVILIKAYKPSQRLAIFSTFEVIIAFGLTIIGTLKSEWFSYFRNWVDQRNIISLLTIEAIIFAAIIVTVFSRHYLTPEESSEETN